MVCEISPLVSYDGEGLEEIVAKSGKTFKSPLVIRSPEEQKNIFNGDK